MKKTMKTVYKIGLLLIALSVFNSCEKEIQPEFVVDNSNSSLFENGIQVNSNSHQIEISFEVNKDWTSKIEYLSGNGWCSTNPIQGGFGKNKITIDVFENLSFEDRELNVIFNVEGLVKKLKIKQFAKEYLAIQPSAKKIIGKGDVFDVIVNSNIDFNLEIPDTCNWISYTSKSSSNKGNYTFMIEVNPFQNSRKGFVFVKGVNNELIDTLIIHQDSVFNHSFRGTANSYVISPNTFGKIKISNKGNNVNQKLEINESTKHQVLWEENKSGFGAKLINDVAIIGEYLYFQTSNYEGNVLIAIKNDNEIIWSWHLWILNDAESINNFQKTTRLGFMVRNLGAIKNTDAGLHYQWGRKDPILFGKYTEKPIAENIEESIKNPTVYFDRTAATDTRDAFSWYKKMSTALWGKDKTIYDPSPYGYIVPDKAMWSVPEGVVGWSNQYFIYDQADAYYPSGIHIEAKMAGNSGWAPYWTTPAFYFYPHGWVCAYPLDQVEGKIYRSGIAVSDGLNVRSIRYNKEN